MCLLLLNLSESNIRKGFVIISRLPATSLTSKLITSTGHKHQAAKPQVAHRRGGDKIVQAPSFLDRVISAHYRHASRIFRPIEKND